jgi:hypothetical protein
MRYEDLVLQFGPETPRGLTVRAASTAGEARGFFTLDAQETLEKDFAECVRARRRAISGAERRAREIGAALFDSVFHGEIRSLLDRHLGHLERQRSDGLRIRMKIDLTESFRTSIHSLPWELIYRTDTGEFLGLSRRTPLVRYLDVPRAVPPIELPEVLRVLSLSPAPRRQPELDLRSEQRNLHELQRSVPGLRVESPTSADLETLRRALVEGEVHVLHLMGHADFDPDTGRGFVALAAADGREEVLGAEGLVAAVGDCTSLRLVVLNACNTGRAAAGHDQHPFLGLAPALMRAGLPAVLAMQLPISDAGAIAFSEAFYRRLLAGDPLDAAVTEGRHAIAARGPRPLEWSVPVLFLRAAEGATAQVWRSLGLDHLRAGNYEEAIGELRQEAARNPAHGLLRVALGVALGRGRELRRLPYQTAREMHRLFAEAMTAPETPEPARAAAIALLGLKLDYFVANSVRDAAPSREEVLAELSGASASPGAEWLLGRLHLTEEARQHLEPLIGIIEAAS